MFKTYGSNITIANNQMYTFPTGSPHIKHPAFLLDVSRGSINPTVSGNSIYSYEHGEGLLMFGAVKNGHAYDNYFYSRNASGDAVRIISADNVLIENNIFDVSNQMVVKFEGTNKVGGVTLRNNTITPAEGCLYFSWMYGEEKKNITIETNTIDGGANNIVLTTKFITLLELANNGVALNNVKIIGNKILQGPHRNTEGFVVREMNSKNLYSYKNVIFENNSAEGPNKPFLIHNTSGIILRNNTDQ